MSTIGYVGVREKNGDVTIVCLLKDAYPSRCRPILSLHHNSEEAARTLLEDGDLYQLSRNPVRELDRAWKRTFYPERPLKVSSYAYLYLWDVETGQWLWAAGNEALVPLFVTPREIQDSLSETRKDAITIAFFQRAVTPSQIKELSAILIRAAKHPDLDVEVLVEERKKEEFSAVRPEYIGERAGTLAWTVRNVVFTSPGLSVDEIVRRPILDVQANKSRILRIIRAEQDAGRMLVHEGKVTYLSPVRLARF